MDIHAKRRIFTPLRFLVAAGMALLVLAAGTVAYPRMAAAAAPSAMLIALRATIVLSLIVVLLLPVAAIVKRLVR
jgi:hypothetical protein